MNDVAFSVKDLSKVYRLYRTGSSRVLDFLGMGEGVLARRYDEHWALKNLSFDIAKRSTVGIVGRNGAGKSTLLRLLAGTSGPTSGEVVRHGQVAALLELGTGFHPDLTGHENIYASGLYLGFDRRAMQTFYNDIVGFSELGTFIHQPVRTYSTGMYMRLAFSVATCLPADIQVIDEVLGVGDAYFFGKCLQRFRQFQKEGRTTVLVSHDNATLLRLCSRCVWIEHGRIAADGSPLEVIMAYTEAVQAEQDRKSRTAWSDLGGTSDAAFAMRKQKAVEIEEVQFLDVRHVPTNALAMGDTITIRIHCHARVAMERAVVTVSIFRSDGVTVCNVISSIEDVHVRLYEGRSTIDVQFAPLLLGPGEYTVAVGMYPSLDLNDSVSPQHAVIWHRRQMFSVHQPVGIALDLGIVRHPVTWAICAHVVSEERIAS